MAARKGQSKRKQPAGAAHLAAHRNRKGRPAPKFLKPIEEMYCQRRGILGLSIRKTAADLQLNEGTCLGWESTRPLIVARIEQLRKETSEEDRKRLQEERLVTVPLIDHHRIRLLAAAKQATLPIARMFEQADKTLGLVPAFAPVRATGRGDAREHPDLPPSTGPNHIDVYEGKWLRDRKAAWNEEFERKHATPTPAK